MKDPKVGGFKVKQRSLAKKVIKARASLGLSQQETTDLIGVPLIELQQLEAQAFVEGTNFKVETTPEKK